MELLTRKQQVFIFRLRIGHCRLLAHLHRLRTSHTDDPDPRTRTPVIVHCMTTFAELHGLKKCTWKRNCGERRSRPRGSLRIPSPQQELASSMRRITKKNFQNLRLLLLLLDGIFVSGGCCCCWLGIICSEGCLCCWMGCFQKASCRRCWLGIYVSEGCCC